MVSGRDRLFVYGTLMRRLGGRPHRLLAGRARYLGPAWTPGRLYALDGYPGLVPARTSRDRVHGELYLVLDAPGLFARLDEYEACAAGDGEYRRCRVQVHWRGGCSPAWAYLYTRPITGRRRIAGGDYAAHLAWRRES